MMPHCELDYGLVEEQMAVHMTGRWQTGAGPEHDTVTQHDNTVLAGTAHPAFVPPRLLMRLTDQVPSDLH